MYRSPNRKTVVQLCGTLFLILGMGLTSCASPEELAVTRAATMPAATVAQAPIGALPAPSASTATGSQDPEPTRRPTAVASTAALRASPVPAASPVSTAPAEPETPGRPPWPQLLHEIDLGIPAGNSYGPGAMALDATQNRLYVRTHVPTPDYEGKGVVAVLDLETGEVLAVVETGPDDHGEGQLALDPGRHRLYVVNPGEATCSVLDTETLQPVDTLEGIDHLALDPQDGLLYVSGLGGLRVLAAASYDVVREAAITSAPQVHALALDPNNGRLYAVTGDGGDVLDVYRTADLAVQATVSLPGPPDNLLADAARGRVYLSLNDGTHSLFWVLDLDGNLLDEEQLGDWLRHTPLSLDSTGNRLFLGRDVYGDYGITLRDLETGRDMGNVPLDTSPNTLAWDAQSGRLLVGQTYRDRVVVVDVQGEPSCTGPDRCVLATFPTAINLDDVAVDPARGQLYVTDTVGWLHVLDCTTGEELARLPGTGRIAVDSPHGRIYTGGDGASTVRGFDADRPAQAAEIESPAIPVADAHDGGLYLVHNGIYIADPETLTITGVISDTLPQDPGFSPNPSAVDAVVDPGSGRLFALINNGIPGSNNGTYLSVYEPPAFDRIFTDGERSPIYLAIDPNSGQAYVSRTHLAGRSTSLLEDGRHYTARLDAVFGALRVDPGLGRVYLSDSGEPDSRLLVLDAANLDVLGSVPIPQGFTLRALDAVRHSLYLATREGKIQFWSATGGELPKATPAVRAPLPLEQVQRLYTSADGSILFAARLYRSTDGGQSWFDIGYGLPARGVQQVVVSPHFDQDQTLFVVPVASDDGLGIWKSTGGGGSWRMANVGLSDLAVTGVVLSPAFPDDGTLFATTRRQGLFRSTDGGASWESLTGRYQPEGGLPDQAGLVALSPTYAQDRTLFVAQYGLQRSTDGGDSWIQVQAQEPESLALSPTFAQDGTVFGWFGAAGLLRSADYGQTWSAYSVGLSLPTFGTGRVIVSPDYASSQTVYFIWSPHSPGTPVQFYRSVDAAQTWQQLGGAAPQGLTPVELSPDGSAFVALDGAGHLARWPLEDLSWQPVALPPIHQIGFDYLIVPPDFGRDRTLFAMSEGVGILLSEDAGLTWTDTRFPLRITSGETPLPLILPSNDLVVGTVLGLYRLEANGTWAVAGGGLPLGVPATTPSEGAGETLRLIAGPEEAGKVFVSTDGGSTWTVAIGTLPAGATADTLVLSPALATDRTAFFAPSWGKLQCTAGGSDWKECGPPGAGSLGAFQISPAFEQDGLLIARFYDNSLWRSADRGDTWRRIDGPWAGEAPMAVMPSTDYRLRAVTFSPAFRTDDVLLTLAGNAVYRSTDRGDAWIQVLDLKPGLSQAVFSPDYAQDGILYLLQGTTLFHSADRGQTWNALPPAAWGAAEEIHLEISPTFARDRSLCVWTLSGRVYESQDGGQSWRETSQGLAGQNIRQVVFSPRHAADGLIFLVPYNTGLFKQVSGGAWLPITESPPLSAPTPMASPPAPTRTPTPATCAVRPDRFQDAWQQAPARLGCPQDKATQIRFAEQPFEHGRMFWDSGTLKIYVLLDDGPWSVYGDTFDEQVDPAYDPSLPPPPRQPQRGFGKVWREQLGGSQAAIGWAVASEGAVDGWRQRFEHGLLIWSNLNLSNSGGAGTGGEGRAYLLYDDGTWQAVRSPLP